MTTGRPPIPALVGMVHLLPLPGSPRYRGSMQEVIEDAAGRAGTLTDAGFGAIMVENFADTPFYAETVPPVTVAAMATCLAALSGVPAVVGVNVLRNDAIAAVSLAAVAGAALVRVNVLTGLMNTDQGPIRGQAAEVARRRQSLAPATEIWADVMVKHATPPPGLELEQAALDTFERGGADALVLSGSGTGHAPDLGSFRRVRSVLPTAPLVAGSGAHPANLAELAELADHIVVGTALEADGRPGAPLDPGRVDLFMEKARSVGLA